MSKTITGDLIGFAKARRFDVIVHGCNCYCTMGAGIAKQIKKEFPAAYKSDCDTLYGDPNKLGSYTSASVGGLTVINAYTQLEWRGKGVKVDYSAVRKVFRQIKTHFSGLRIGYPKIGAGLAGGDWDVIAQIIDEELHGENHTLVVLPC